MNATKVKTIDDLPELPFEKVLSYLGLSDRLKSRAISPGWYQRINSLKVNTLCFSARPLGFTLEKNRWASGVFARNFIGSHRFVSFFATFARSILSNLRHLRLLELNLEHIDGTTLALTINSFSQLEELDIIRLNQLEGLDIDDYKCYSNPEIEFELNLPMLTSLQMESVYGIEKLTLDAPKLRKIKLAWCSNLVLVVVHGESVEMLLIKEGRYIAVKSLKKLKILHIGRDSGIYPTDLSVLDQLKEVHLTNSEHITGFFKCKQRYGRVDLKIYFQGHLLNGPEDGPTPSFFRYYYFFREEKFVNYAEDPSRLADEMPLQHHLLYSKILHVYSEVANDLMSRFTDLYQITVDQPVQDIEYFLRLLKNFNNISKLAFTWTYSSQDLFDRLPEHCAVQSLVIKHAVSNLEFLYKLKHLINLQIYVLDFPIDPRLIRKLFQLPYLTWLNLIYSSKEVCIKVKRKWTNSKQFQVRFKSDGTYRDVYDLEVAIQFFLDL